MGRHSGFLMDNQPAAAPWQPLRLLQTLAFFQLNPFLSELRQKLPILEPLIPAEIAMPSPNLPAPHFPAPQSTQGAVLVLDASQAHQAQPSPQSLQIMQTLLQKGYPVRAVTADLAGIPPHLSTAPHLTWVTADLTQPNTLAPESLLELREGVNTLVLCLAPEGTPAANSLELSTLLQLLKAHGPGQGAITPLFDFRAPTPAQLQIWGALDDVVMGGVSESRLQRLPTAVLFTGNVSTANSGGFASVRTQNFQPALNLGNSTGIELRLRGDGNRYKFFIRADSRWDGVGYAYSLDTVAETWQTLRLPFAEFIPVMRANRVSNAPNLNPEQIYSFQIMLSKFEYDRQLNPQFTPGSFALEIEQINAYSDAPLPCLIGLGDAEPELVAQCQNLGLTFQLLPYSNWEKTLPDSIHFSSKSS
jgi:uncharacterized protein YbjT (DUF2867 family)